MTSRRERGGLTWLAAPVAAGTFALAAQWTLHHQPGHAVPQLGDRLHTADLASVEHDTRIAARRLVEIQASLLQLESSLQRRSTNVDRLDNVLHATRRIPAGWQGSGGTLTPAPAPLAPVQIPTSVHTTTGAS